MEIMSKTMKNLSVKWVERDWEGALNGIIEQGIINKMEVTHEELTEAQIAYMKRKIEDHKLCQISLLMK